MSTYIWDIIQYKYHFGCISFPLLSVSFCYLSRCWSHCISIFLNLLPHSNAMCPISSDPFYLVTYYIKWVTVSWTDSRKYRNIKLIHMKEIELFLPFILALSPALFVYKYITVHGCLRSKACDKYLVILCKKLTYSNADIYIYIYADTPTLPS